MSTKAIAIALAALGLALVGDGEQVGAQTVRPVFHEESRRLVDEMSGQIRRLGDQMAQHFLPGAPGGRRGGMMGPGEPMGPGGVSPAERPLLTIMLHHRSEIGLTAEQVARLETLRGDFARETIRREADIRVAELDVANLLGQETVDLSRVEAKVRESAQLRAEYRVARLRTLEQGKAVLTVEQRTKLQEVLGAHGHGHGPGPSAPPRRSSEGGTRL